MAYHMTLYYIIRSVLDIKIHKHRFIKRYISLQSEFVNDYIVNREDIHKELTP